MNYRKLGSTGISVSEIGFGTWGIGGAGKGAIGYGETDDAQSSDALLAAVEHGITFFDTSDLYGYGHSEELVGSALKKHRERIVICSKAGFANGENQDFSSGYIESCIGRSLRRLRTDYLDLYLLHSPSPEHLAGNDGLFSLLQKLKSDGKIRAWGISARNPAEALAMLGTYSPECLEVNFNLVDLRAIKCGLWEACHGKNIGIIARTPLAFGFLSGKVAPDQVFGGQDHRQRFPAEIKKRWSDAVGVYREVFQKGETATPAQNALRFCLSYPEVSSVIPGMLSRGEVVQNVAASEMGRLEASQMEEILSLSMKYNFF